MVPPLDVDGPQCIKRQAKPSSGFALRATEFITCSREYADGEDPFKWPKRLRNAAIGHISVTYDDNAAFPRAKLAMTPEHSRMGRLFLEHRPHIYEQYGAYLFREEPDASERRKWVKRITNGYDMGAKLSFFVEDKGVNCQRVASRSEASLPAASSYS